MVFSMLAAALAEGLGIAALLPLINLVIGPSANQGALGACPRNRTGETIIQCTLQLEPVCYAVGLEYETKI